MNFRNKKGFTLLEVILVILLIGSSMGLSAIYSQTSQVRADLNTQANLFTSHARLAHTSALSGLNNSDHGIHLETNSYTVFAGSSYNGSDPANYIVTLPPTVTITNISLNGSGTDLIFTQPYGETTTYGTLDFVSSKISKTINLTITKLGTINF